MVLDGRRHTDQKMEEKQMEDEEARCQQMSGVGSVSQTLVVELAELHRL